MKITFEQKLFPLPNKFFKTMKLALRYYNDELLSKEQINDLENLDLHFEYLGNKICSEIVTGYIGEQKFDENYNIEMIIRLKETQK